MKLSKEYTDRKEIESESIRVLTKYLKSKDSDKYGISLYGDYNSVFESVVEIMKDNEKTQDHNYPFLWSLKEKLKPFIIEDRVKRIMELSLCHRYMEDFISRLLTQSFRGQEEEGFKIFQNDLARFAKIIKFSFEVSRKELFITQDELNELHTNSRSDFKDVNIKDDSKRPELNYRDLLMKSLYDEILAIIEEIEQIEKV